MQIYPSLIFQLFIREKNLPKGPYILALGINDVQHGCVSLLQNWEKYLHWFSSVVTGKNQTQNPKNPPKNLFWIKLSNEKNHSRKAEKVSALQLFILLLSF